MTGMGGNRDSNINVLWTHSLVGNNERAVTQSGFQLAAILQDDIFVT